MNPMKPGIRYGQEFTANRRTAPGCPCMAHGSCTTRAQARDATRNTLHAIAKRAKNRALHELRALRAPGIPGHTRWRVAPILESPVTDSPPRRRAALLHCEREPLHDNRCTAAKNQTKHDRLYDRSRRLRL